MHRIRSRSVRLLLIPALTLPFVCAAVLALPGAASAKGGPKPKAAVCSSLSGNTGSTVSLSGCTSGANPETGGGGTFSTFSLNPSGTDTVTWNNGAKVTFSSNGGLTPKDKCAGAPTTLEAKISGAVISNSNLPAGDPGVKSPVKATVCATPAGGPNFTVKLAKGTFKI